MTLVVEDGTGLSTADSYISLADANTYVAAHGALASWTAAADADKEEALRLAAQYIDLKYGSRFLGTKYLRDQALCWPRDSVVDDQGHSYEYYEIPNGVLQAQVEAAMRVIEGDDLLDVIDEPGTISSESVTVGPIQESKSYMGGKSQVKKYPKVDLLLRPVLYSSDRVERA